MGTNIKFHQNRFNDAIKRHGLMMLLEKAQPCACYNTEVSDSSPACPYCDGLHFVWKAYGVIPALMVGIKEVRRQISDINRVNQGDVSLTTLPEDKLAINDRLRLIHSPEIYSETIETTVNSEGETVFVPFYEIAEVLSIKDEFGGDISLSLCDYNFVKDEIKLNYVTPKISIRYKHYPFLLVSDIAHSNRQQWTFDAGSGTLQNLPNQYIAQRVTTKLKTSFINSFITKDELHLDDTSDERSLTYTLQEYDLENKINTLTFDICFYFDGYSKIILNLTPVNGNPIKEDNYFEVVAKVRTLEEARKIVSNLRISGKFLIVRDKYYPDFDLDTKADLVVELNDEGEVISTTLLQKDMNYFAQTSLDIEKNGACEQIPATVYLLYNKHIGWYRMPLHVTIRTDNGGKLNLMLSDYSSYTKDITIDRPVKTGYNHLFIVAQDTSKISNWFFSLNGSHFNILGENTIIRNLSHYFFNLDKTEHKGEYFHIYSRRLDLFEMQQNMYFTAFNYG